MSADDNLLAAASGALNGFANVFVPMQQAKLQKQLQLDLLRQELPLQEASTLRVGNAQRANEFGYQTQLETQRTKAASDLEHQKANESIQIYDPKTGTYVTVPRNSKVLPWQHTPADKPENRLVKEVYPDGVMRPKEITSDMDNMTLGEAQKLLQTRASTGAKETSNTIAAGKTGILQGVRNNLFGTPGVNTAQSQAFAPPLVPQAPDGLPNQGQTFQGSKVLKVIKVK